MKIKTNTILKDDEGYIIVKDYDEQNDFFICYQCNLFGRVIDNLGLLLKCDDIKHMEFIK